MVKKKFINYIKCSLVVALFAFVGIYSTACACNEIDSERVYDHFVDFVNSKENIFEFEEKTVNSQKVNQLKINIPYNEVVNKKLCYEAFGSNYRGYGCDGSEFVAKATEQVQEKDEGDVTWNVTINYGGAELIGYTEWLQHKGEENYHANFSDFYILKAIYEPMLDAATYQIGKNYQTLKNNSAILDKEKANIVNEKLNAVINASDAVMNSVRVLNNNSNAFSETSLEYDVKNKIEEEDIVNHTKVRTIYPKPNLFKYRDKQEHIYFELKNIKKNFENLIMACFDLNESFMDLHLSIRTTCDFSTVKVEEFTNEEKNVTYKAILNDYLNYMLTMASYASFSIDGGQCSFVNSRDEFAKLYSNIVESDSNGVKLIKDFADRYVFDACTSLIYSSCQNKSLFDFNDDYKDTLREEYLPYIINCQNKFNAFMQQYGNFKNSLNDVDYKAYVMSSNYGNYMDYAKTLENDDRTKFIIVYEFIQNYYKPLAESLAALQNQIIA